MSKYNRYILGRILPHFTDPEFNIYELVKEAVSYKCILPSQNELVMDTSYHVCQYLLHYEFVLERKEMTAYVVTAKGIELKKCGSLEKFEEMHGQRNKKSFLHSWVSRRKPSEITPETLVGYYE